MSERTTDRASTLHGRDATALRSLSRALARGALALHVSARSSLRVRVLSGQLVPLRAMRLARVDRGRPDTAQNVYSLRDSFDMLVVHATFDQAEMVEHETIGYRFSCRGFVREHMSPAHRVRPIGTTPTDLSVAVHGARGPKQARAKLGAVRGRRAELHLRPKAVRQSPIVQSHAEVTNMKTQSGN